MANYASAVNFVLHLEDSTLSGIITTDSDGTTRYGLLDRWHPDLVQAGFYTTDAQTALTMADAAYRTGYWNPIQGDAINSNTVAAQLLSIGVNDSPHEAVWIAQGVLGLNQDGVLGPMTLSALNNQDPDTFLASFNAAAKAYYRQVVVEEPQKAGDLQGWLNRVDAIENYPG